MTGLYHPGASVIHRLPPGVKLLALAVIGTAMFLTQSLTVAGLFLAAVLLLYALAGVPLALLAAQMRPLLWVLAILFGAQWLIDSLPGAVFMVARLAGLILLAALVTLTTRSSAMIETLTRALGPLRALGVNPARVGLTLSLAMRFIPVLAAITAEVREAQAARGLDRSVMALAVPVLLRLLRMSDDIAEAIDARSYDSGSEIS